MVKILVKKLQSQESGYTGMKPNQRGKYILIPKPAKSIFPPLSMQVLNDFKKILLFDVKDSKVFALNFVWHNAKHHQDYDHSRKHDEYRIYRTSMLDEHFLLDKDDIVIFRLRDKNGVIPFLSIKPNSKYYKSLNQQLGNQTNILLDDIPPSIAHFFATPIIGKVGVNDIYNRSELFEENTFESLNERVNEHQDSDPLLPLSSIFKTQSSFKEVVRDIYGNRCAVRKTSLVKNSLVGLEAAHIHPKADGGNHLPSNGLLLSSDLHVAFDSGYFTLTEDNKVLVWNSVPEKSSLWKFDGTIVKPTDAMYKPFKKYTEYHRNNIFGKKIF